jgi:hypothetical protein
MSTGHGTIRILNVHGDDDAVRSAVADLAAVVAEQMPFDIEVELIDIEEAQA